MGLRDELRKARRAMSGGVVAAVLATGVPDRVSDYLAEREADRRLGQFDDALWKAAKRAMNEGRDGSHPFDMDPEDDPQSAKKTTGQEGDASAGGKDGGGGGGGDGDEGDNPWAGAPITGKHNPVRERKAITFDPFDLVSLLGYRDRPTALTYVAMERVATQVPVVSDIIRTRIKQVQTFCQRPEDRHSAGMKVRLRDRNATPTPESEAICKELEDVLLSCGYTDPKNPQDGVPLKDFAAKFVRDSLTFDQAVFEVIPDAKGRPSWFDTVDATTIRLLDPIVAEQEDVFAVQVIEGTVVTDFTRDELAFCIRNPRSGIHTYGYGESEIETLVREITGFLWGIEYNRRFFSQGSTTKGILNFKGAIPDKHMQAFRRQWYAMVSGVANAWRTPITNAEELQWISLQMSNRDMEYGQWMDFLIKVCCARYSIAPEEVNFSYGNTGQSQAMGNTSTEEKLKASKDLGLRPLVQWFFTALNTHVVQRIHPDFEVVPVGLDERGVEAEADLLAKQTGVFLTVDEAREQVGMEPLPDGKGECILNPTWLQFAQGMDMPDGGAPGEDGDNPFGGDEPDEGGDGEEDGEEGSPFGLTDDDGNPVPEPEDDDDNGDNPGGGVAKSTTGAVESAVTQDRPVRYELRV